MIRLIVIGKTSFPFIDDGISMYQKRLSHLAKFHYSVIPFKAKSSWNEQQVKVEEGRLILSHAKESRIVLFDEKGKALNSKGLANFIEDCGLNSTDVSFVIGGPYGFSEDVYARATLKISLGSMTYSHQMIRLMAFEQLYRAHTIIKGLPYHHE